MTPAVNLVTTMVMTAFANRFPRQQLAKIQKSVGQLAEFEEQLGQQHHEMLKSITDFKAQSQVQSQGQQPAA